MCGLFCVLCKLYDGFVWSQFRGVTRCTCFRYMEKKYCLECEESLKGRIDKKFCSDNCRSAFHNREGGKISPMVKVIDHQLKKNREILRQIFSQIGAARDEHEFIVSSEQIRIYGFVFDFYTHRRVLDGGEYLFCYDYGYNKVDEERIHLIKHDLLNRGVDNIA